MSKKHINEEENPAKHAGAPNSSKLTSHEDLDVLFADWMKPLKMIEFDESYSQHPPQYASVVKFGHDLEPVDEPEQVESKLKKSFASWLGESPKVDFAGFGQAKKTSPAPPPLPPPPLPPLPVDWPTNFAPKFNPSLSKMDFAFPKFDFKKFGLDEIDAEPPPPPPPVEEQARQLAKGLRARRQARTDK